MFMRFFSWLMSRMPDLRTKPYLFQIFLESEKNSSSNCMIHIWVENQTAYLAGVADDGGLIIVDVSNPAAPRALGAYTSPTCSESITVSGSLAYLAHGDMGLEIIDLRSVNVIVKIYDLNLVNFGKD